MNLLRESFHGLWETCLGIILEPFATVMDSQVNSRAMIMLLSFKDSIYTEMSKKWLNFYELKIFMWVKKIPS